MVALDELLRIAPIKGHWFHSIEVAPGMWTNGHKSRDVMAAELAAWGFPADLTGKSVLDVGCADGGFSIEALRRGARSVLAIDEQQTRGLGLILAANAFPMLEYRQISLFSDAFMALPRFDFVIFAGVLYHVHDMLEALKRVRARAGGEVLIETHVNESLGTAPPCAIYYERDELGGDVTNWWGPNVACLEAMFRTAGFAFKPRHIHWENDRHANGRASYRLLPVQGSVSADVIESATGSNSMLEEARATIARLHQENAELRRRLSGG
jgi:tRNA (mo5U34)-methyltransferase